MPVKATEPDTADRMYHQDKTKNKIQDAKLEPEIKQTIDSSARSMS